MPAGIRVLPNGCGGMRRSSRSQSVVSADGMCGRPVSWSTGTWRVPHLITTTAENITTITPPVTTMSNVLAVNSGSLIESCEEEDSSTPTDAVAPINIAATPSPAAAITSKQTNYYLSNNITNNRLKAKISLDETKLRTNLESFDNVNFTRSDTITRTLGLDKCESNRSVMGTHKTALARSSSYQALHSALARLYRLDDFITERLGQGFFSEVFKVRL